MKEKRKNFVGFRNIFEKIFETFLNNFVKSQVLRNFEKTSRFPALEKLWILYIRFNAENF